MVPPCPLVATGQQIGAGWSPALSVVKALAALATAQRLGGEAFYWLADEDHDRLEVASVVGGTSGRLRKHRFRFAAPEGTATGWLPWAAPQQREAEELWGEVPLPSEPSLRGHVLAAGEPLWRRGLRPFSPTDPMVREPIQAELERWRALDLETAMNEQAMLLKKQGAPLPLDPRGQAAWFSLDPRNGLRRRLEAGDPLPPGCWLSPGAALRPLMQSLLLAVTHVVLGPAERAYWRLAEPLWERVGLAAPQILPRPSLVLLPKGLALEAHQLESLKEGRWEAFSNLPFALPSERLGHPMPDDAWGEGVGSRFRAEIGRSRARLARLDHRLHRDLAAKRLGWDPERLRQHIFPFGRPQERILPGLAWLRDEMLLDRMLEALDGSTLMILLEAP
jgi:hypothetical protein